MGVNVTVSKFSWVGVDNDKYSKPPVVFRGLNEVDHFLNDLMKEEYYIREKLNDQESHERCNRGIF